MREDVHHDIENDARRGAGSAEDGRKLHDAVGLTAHQTEGGGIVERETGDGQFEDPPEGDGGGAVIAPDNAEPGECIEEVDDPPYPYDGKKPITGAAHVEPQFSIVHVEGEEHDDDSGKAEKQEQVAV